jgi:hypothetical protein
VRSVFLCSLHDGASRDERGASFAAVLRARHADGRPRTHAKPGQARLSRSLRNRLRQREKLPNPPIYDFATTRQQSLANNFVF